MSITAQTPQPHAAHQLAPAGGNAAGRTAGPSRHTGRRAALSPAALERLDAELAALTTERATRAADTVEMSGDAADVGELAARDMLLEQLDQRIARIHELLAMSALSTPITATETEGIAVGSAVTLRFEGDTDTEDYLLADLVEQDSSHTVITPDSPLGKALIGAEAGVTVTYPTPRGTGRVTVVSVS
jgi:transcription elongation factor GreA